MVRIYVSAPMNYIPTFSDLIRKLVSAYEVSLYVPFLTENDAFSMDIANLNKCDFMVTHVPEASIGTACEITFAYLRQIPIIGYKCIHHPWLDRMIYRVDDQEKLQEVLSEMIYSLL